MRVYALSEDIYLHYNDLNTWEINIKNENFEINILNHGVILSLLPFLEVGREKIIEKIGDLQKWLVFPEIKVVCPAGVVPLTFNFAFVVKCAYETEVDQEI